MKFRTLLTAGFASVCLLMSIMSWLALNTEDSLEESFEQVMHDRYPKVSMSQHIISDTNRIANAIYLSAMDPEQPLDRREIDRIFAEIDRKFSELALLTKLDRGRELLAASTSAYQAYKRNMETVMSVRSEGVPLGSARLNEAVQAMEKEHKQYNLAIQQYIEFQEAVMEDSSRKAFQSVRTGETVIMGSLAAGLAFSALIAAAVLHRANSSIRRITSVMESFKPLHHEHLPRIPVLSDDEFSRISHTYNKMAQALELRAEQEKLNQQALEEENWIKSHLAEITDMYQDNRNLSEFGNKLLSKLLPLVDGVYAAFYVLDRSREYPLFERKAAYAADSGTEGKTAFLLGEGLVGQCAADGKPVEIRFPREYADVVTGFGAYPPSHLLLLPIAYGGEIIAVLELGSFHDIDGKKRILLMQLTGQSMGTMIRNMQYQKHVEKLYAESQTFNEELQVQSEELLQQQEALRALNERLEEQVNIADANSRYKSEFLANMSHELRTPLNSLLILGQILMENKEGNLTPKQTEYAETIVMSGNQLLSLINDILDLSKIEAGQLTLKPESFGLSAFMADIELQFRALAERKGLRFSMSIDSRLDSATLHTDRQRLLQIIQNLLSNALKFTDNGEISLRAFLQGGNPDLLGIEVRDTGIGIAKEHHGLIFEAFKQVEGNTNRKYGGTGLGLSISQELAALIGGSLQMDSALGAGSTFTFRLPYDGTGQEAMLQAAAAAEPARTAPSFHGRPVRLLLVDDDLRNIYSLSSALEEYGYSIICAENGTEALELLDEHQVDLVLMDIMMPDMDGFETIRSIRASETHRDIPIVALTAKAMKEDRDLCIEAGADDYISKPVRLDKLLSIIRVWVPERFEP